MFPPAWPDNTFSFTQGLFLTVTSGWHKVLLPHTNGGFTPSLYESPAVSGYIIAEPCWARRTALCACHWMWLWVRLSGGWEATVKGFLPGLQQRWQRETESEVFLFFLESSLMWLTHGVHCVDERRCLLTCLMFYVLCIAWVKTSEGEAQGFGEGAMNWASSGRIFEQMTLTKCYFSTWI